tara:strand:+ start:572 stop:1495 length:924 start_codon:yes stop_codon:yes gene_type:complete
MSVTKLNKFMKDMIFQLENKGLSASTISMYMKRLYIINDNKPFRSLTFLKDTEKIISSLKERLSPSTQKSYAGTILSVLSIKDTKTNAKLKKVYNSFISDEEIAEINEYNTSDKQKENWITQEQIAEIKANLEKNALAQKEPVTITGYNMLLKNVLLSFFVNLPPRRASDYALMKYQDDTSDMNFNYLTSKNVLVFHNYKTSKTHGTQVMNISKNKPLIKDIKMYLKYRKTNQDNFLLVKFSGKEFNTINDITRSLNNIFGKKISTNMLRNMYVSHKYGSIKEDMKEDAAAMSHSVNTQQTVYNKGS